MDIVVQLMVLDSKLLKAKYVRKPVSNVFFFFFCYIGAPVVAAKSWTALMNVFAVKKLIRWCKHASRLF